MEGHHFVHMSNQGFGDVTDWRYCSIIALGPGACLFHPFEESAAKCLASTRVGKRIPVAKLARQLCAKAMSGVHPQGPRQISFIIHWPAVRLPARLPVCTPASTHVYLLYPPSLPTWVPWSSTDESTRYWLYAMWLNCCMLFYGILSRIMLCYVI